jgi:acyl carrier protein
MQLVDFDQMARHISSLVSVPVARLTPETTITELTPDSFMFVEMAVDLQEEYDVVLTQHDLKDLRTLGDLASLLQRRQSGLPDTELSTDLGGQVPTAHAG